MMEISNVDLLFLERKAALIKKMTIRSGLRSGDERLSSIGQHADDLLELANHVRAKHAEQEKGEKEEE